MIKVYRFGISKLVSEFGCDLNDEYGYHFWRRNMNNLPFRRYITYWLGVRAMPLSLLVRKTRDEVN